MKNNIPTLIIILLLFISTGSYSQEFQWQVVNPTFNATDPDGAGPATGSVSFTIQLRTRVALSTIPVSAITIGVSYQSSKIMLPTGVPCGTSSGAVQPSNISVSPSFPSYTYNAVNHCSGVVNFTAGGQLFDRRAVGTFDGGAEVTITNTWTNVYTTTFWTLSAVTPQGGYIALNSTNLAAPGPNSNFELSDDAANTYQASSLTYTTPLAIGSVLPVTYTNFTAGCTDKGALVKWATGTEINSDYFELQRSKDGNDWATVSKVKAKGNSTTETSYEQMDPLGGAAMYRLKQFDFDGKFYYSNIIRTNCADRNTEIVIYPVPAKDVLNVVVRTDKAVKTQFEIFDAAGRLVKKVNAAIIAGNNNIPINLTGLADGQYIIRSTDPALTLNKKFTILH